MCVHFLCFFKKGKLQQNADFIIWHQIAIHMVYQHGRNFLIHLTDYSHYYVGYQYGITGQHRKDMLCALISRAQIHPEQPRTYLVTAGMANVQSSQHWRLREEWTIESIQGRYSIWRFKLVNTNKLLPNRSELRFFKGL